MAWPSDGPTALGEMISSTRVIFSLASSKDNASEDIEEILLYTVGSVGAWEG